jgi:hypothetical protein
MPTKRTLAEPGAGLGVEGVLTPERGFLPAQLV